MEENCKEFLDDILDSDFRVFVYVFIFKRTVSETAKRLSVRREKVRRTVEYLKNLREFKNACNEILNGIEDGTYPMCYNKDERK